jgi:hypothetical protein
MVKEKEKEKTKKRKKESFKYFIYSELLVTSKIGQDIIAAILGDIERLHGDEQCKNFELG